MNKYAIFGCGYKGKKILSELGIDKVICFIDNNQIKQGGKYNNIPIYSLDYYKSLNTRPTIIIPVSEYYDEVKKQLEDNKIFNWIIYKEKTLIGDENKLIANPYEFNSTISYEKNTQKSNRDLIKDYATQLNGNIPIFNGIEIETYNRCNGVCQFCPVSIQNESRSEKKMEEKLFKKIVDNLYDIDYAGNVCLFSNNEPFLDDRIIEFQMYLREKVTKAHLYLYTNGTLLTIEKFKKIIDFLDELIIDNYNQELKLHSNVKQIVEYCSKNELLKKKVTVMLRKPNEVLTSRGGDAPNKREIVENYLNDSCILPFKQMIVRPDGKVSLCCNDPLGKYTLGDLNDQSLEEIWYGELYRNIREKIISGRKNIEKCKLCDVFLV